MKLVIVTPQAKQEHTIQWIEAYTPNGHLFIRPGHAPIILTLLAGSDFLFLLMNNEKKIIHLTRPGFLEVKREHALALISQEI